ncbi:AraC family transcriptional regulator [Georgenia sp. Z1491]|uniref:helix-turn-helix transcriptional regulator n=1 Tax=Georgenia sp. Z1491 TaxID=3416707 RepID=UPI003CF89BDB
MSRIRHHPEAPTEVRHLPGGAGVDLHRHDGPQLISASTGVLEVLTAEGTWFTPPTRAVLVPGGTAHTWRVHGATTVRMVGMPTPTQTSVNHPDDPAPSLVVVTPLVRELLVACSEQGRAETPAERRLLSVLADQVLPAREAPTVVPVLRDERLRRVAQVVEERLAEGPSLSDVAREVGAGERTLSRLFSSELGMSFTTWRHQVRLHRANLLLAQGRSVTRVAADCGYATPSAFITVFRAALGRTPGSVYR